MPEAPEVLILAENLHENFSNKYLLTIWQDKFNHFKDLDKIPFPNRLLSVTANGKKIIFTFEKGYLLSSLGMQGGWYIERNIKLNPSTLFRSVWANELKSKLNEMVYEICSTLSYDDSRHFGWLEYFETEEKLLARLDLGIYLLRGSLDDTLTFERWKTAILRGRRTKICETILEQKYVSGIGNYLRAEIMYDAKINPLSITGELIGAELKRLFENSKKIILEAYRKGGANGDYTDLNGNTGHYEHLVYKRGKDKLGNKVESFKDKNNRTVWYVPNIQE